MQKAREEAAPQRPKTYTLDLDAPPFERWRQVATDFAPTLSLVEKQIDALPIPRLAQYLAHVFADSVSHIDELRGIAHYSGLNLQKLILMQFAYEACAHCTSVVVGECADARGPAHVRTMEWEMPFLKHITIQVEYVRAGRVVAYASTWAGYVGVLTGMRRNAFSVSVNYRQTNDSYVQNLVQVVKRAWPIGFLVRDCITDEQSTYRTAVERLRTEALVSPVYFIVCGMARDEGAVVTRNRTGDENLQSLADGASHVFQTNMDHWLHDPDLDMFSSLDRVEFLDAYFDARSARGTRVSRANLWDLVSQDPVMSEQVIYATLMVPADDVFETRTPVRKARRGGGEYVYSVKEVAPSVVKKNCEPLICGACNGEYHEELNARGLCAHAGKWHQNFYRDCRFGRCFWSNSLRMKFSAHWSCCHSTDKTLAVCVTSERHAPGGARRRAKSAVNTN